MSEQPAAPAQALGIPPKDQANFAASRGGNEPYQLRPDSLPQAGVPRGAIRKFHLVSERIYPGVGRDVWLYTPPQSGGDGDRPANLMVFQDGESNLGPPINAPTVFDNLIAKGEIPPLVGVFVNPGDKGPGSPIYGGDDNRSFEYDSLSDLYVRFLLEELLPLLEPEVRLTADPDRRAICGVSSGGICAFTAAWQRPDAFRKVVSHCGSFTNIRGGNAYPSLIRLTERKPIRVFLQGGSNDLDVIYGNWAIANQDMAAALAYREYDYRFEFGVGGHTLFHAGSIFPDTLRWLWR